MYGDTKHHPEMANQAEPPLVAEFDNVRAAMTWLDESGNVPGLARLAGAIWYYWVLHGPRKEGAYWIERASTIVADSTLDKTSKLWVNQGICEFAETQGRLEQANAVCRRAALSPVLENSRLFALWLRYFEGMMSKRKTCRFQGQSARWRVCCI